MGIEARGWHHEVVDGLGEGLVEGRKLPRRLQVSGGGPWFLAATGSLRRVGAGDLGFSDLGSVAEKLGDRVFVALPVPRLEADPLASDSPWAIRRSQRMQRRRLALPPTVAALARGAQVAVLPGVGVVWVDSARLFRHGEVVPLPWTDPRVSLPVVRPRQIREAMRRSIGPGGPKRVEPSDDD